MSYSVLQSKNIAVAGTGTGAISFPGANTNGSLLIYTACYSSAATISAISDGTNTWNKIGSQTDSTNSQKVDLWWATNTATTTLTETPTHSGSLSAYTAVIVEFSGVTTTSPLDVSDATKAFSATSLTANAETATSISPTSGDLLVAAFGDTGGIQASITAGTGFTVADKTLGVSGTGASAVEYETAPGGAVTATLTVGTASHNYTMQVGAFKALAGGFVGAPPLVHLQAVNRAGTF